MRAVALFLVFKTLVRATAKTASAEEDEIEIEPEEVIEGSDSMDFTGGEGGVSLMDEADPDIEPYATADEFGEIAADVKEEAAIVAEDTAGWADQVWHHNYIFLRCQRDASEENGKWNRL